MGGGTGPADGTRATTCTPAPLQMKLMLQSTDELPMNFGFTGKVCLLLCCMLYGVKSFILLYTPTILLKYIYKKIVFQCHEVA